MTQQKAVGVAFNEAKTDWKALSVLNCGYDTEDYCFDKSGNRVYCCEEHKFLALNPHIVQSRKDKQNQLVALIKRIRY